MCAWIAFGEAGWDRGVMMSKADYGQGRVSNDDRRENG